VIRHAEMLARCGWRVFPCHTMNGLICSCGDPACSSAGKHPRTLAGVKDASTDLVQLAAWWERWPEANIGVATGNGLYVIDLDGDDGTRAWSQLVEQHGWREMIPAGVVAAQTGGGGFHLYFTISQQMPNTAGRLGNRIDTRGDGGYVLAPPSLHKSGRRYGWISRPAPLLPTRPLPDWVGELMARRHESERVVERFTVGSTSRYGRAVLDACVDRISRAPDGQRNETLAREAFKVGQLVGGGEIDPAGVLDLLASSVRDDGDPRKTRSTAERQLREGLAYPRTKEDMAR
jgi:hypothetical protein